MTNRCEQFPGPFKTFIRTMDKHPFFRGVVFALGLWMFAPELSCATAGPIAVKCGLQDIAIAAADYAEIAADIQAKDWDDLAKEGEKLGWATLDCVLGDQVAQNPSVKANVYEFRRLKSVEFRAAGGSACGSRGGVRL